ncbi:MAG: acetyl esterase [Lachnospiraceae bacterium]|nr:acetyl esterase [Lachnospiraceae bacterium]
MEKTELMQAGNAEKNKVEPYTRMSDGMRKVVEFQENQSGDAFETGGSWEELREKYEKERLFWNEGGPIPYKIREHEVPGPCGKIRVRLYYPDAEEKHHALVFIHGGGFTVGSNNTHDRIMRSLMEASGCVVIGVDYHLAPEVKFPIQLYECAEVVKYFHERGSEFGLFTETIALSGDSGGANLAMNTNLYLRDIEKGNSYISALLLYYGSYGLEDSVSQRLHGTSLDGMRKCDLEYYMSCYFENVQEDSKSPYFASLNNDLTYGIPPVYLCCGDLDPLLDDSTALYHILKNQGIYTELEIIPGCLHAYLHYGRMMEEAVYCIENSSRFLRKILEKGQ